MTNNQTILITGVTGKQGGAVAQALKSTGFRLRGLTRKPDSEQAAALARQGVDIMKGDLDDETTLRRALTGVWGVFGVQNAAEAGVQREEEQGQRLATLAREAGVEHYVYTSVGSAHKQTGVPHFDNKWRIEETVRGLRFPSHVILRPVFFMENLMAPFSLQGDTLSWALGPATKLQMTAVDDIGWFGARAFTHAATLNRREIDLAGDVRTMAEAAEILTKALGRPITFAQTSIEPVRQYSKEMALMLEWFERVGYSADIAGLEREFGRALTKLQMIAVDDIGWFGARAFTDAAALNRREIDLGGDVRTLPEAAEILTE
ncbi:MAG TPA: NmrA/HSCARG family protein, partial [Stellaceae bacterium]|nr:NmrA/HSCARG family protein [Stellaceae bacterium]